MINLGDKVKDKITGFEGIAVARVEYLTGCTRYEVKPDKLKDEKTIDSEWIDERQLTVTKSDKIVLNKSDNAGPGNIPTVNYPKR